MGKGIVLNLIARVAFIVGSYGMHATLARVLGPATYGSFGVCLSVLLLAQFFTNNGLRQIVSRLTSMEADAAAPIMRKGLVAQGGIVGAVALLLFVFAEPLAGVFRDPALAWPLRFLGAAVVFQGLSVIVSATLVGLKRFLADSAVGALSSLFRPIFPVLLVLLVPAYPLSATVIGLGVAALGALCLSLWFARRLGQQPIEMNIVGMLRDALPVIVALGCVTLTRYFDLLAVKALASSESAGYYNAATSVSQVAYLLMLSFGTVSLPYFSEASQSDERSDPKLLAQTLRDAFLLLLPMAVGISTYADVVVQLMYGAGYEQAVGLLRLTIFGTLGIGTFYLIAQYLIATGDQLRLLLVAVAMVIANTTLNIVLIGAWGALGGACATVSAAWFAVALSIGWLLPHLVSRLGPLVRVVAVGGLAYVGTALLLRPYVPTVLLQIALSVVLYLALHGLLRVITARDVALARSLIASRFKST